MYVVRGTWAVPPSGRRVLQMDHKATDLLTEGVRISIRFRRRCLAVLSIALTSVRAHTPMQVKCRKHANAVSIRQGSRLVSKFVC